MMCKLKLILGVLLAFLFITISSPAAARWLSVDPVQANPNTGADFNRYRYANNNPYKFTDPDGRESACFATGTGCGINAPTAQDRAAFEGAVEATVRGAANLFLSQFSDGPGGAVAGTLGIVAKGAEGVALSRAAIKEAGGAVKGGEVGFRTPTGKLTKADTVATQNGKTGIVESKNGPTARLSPNQTEAKATVEAGGGLTPVGKNAEAAGFKTGQPVKLDYYKVDHFNITK